MLLYKWSLCEEEAHANYKGESFLAAIHTIREKLIGQEYEFTIPHFFEEMANDDLIFADIEKAVLNGRIQRKFTRDPRGTRYEIIGRSLDGR
ncbi:MAG: hypothetical protein A2Z50_05695 [Nitrospirae bacterium RBG_19FT_COMBO_42_15]|nr:MAG: hypothetical protein A2Z50_05695 [Nitrospirae bacterium RBG_19FT_COMBO_42_15]